MTQKYFILGGQELIKSLHQNREHLSEIISVLKNCYMGMQFYHGSQCLMLGVINEQFAYVSTMLY